MVKKSSCKLAGCGVYIADFAGGSNAGVRHPRASAIMLIAGGASPFGEPRRMTGTGLAAILRGRRKRDGTSG
jgi:hypothetical protein